MPSVIWLNVASIAAVGFTAETRAESPEVTMPFELKANLIVVHAGVDGSPLRFILDTGASQSVIADETARRLALPTSDARRGIGAGGRVDVTLAPIRRLTLGEAAVTDLTCLVTDLREIRDALGGGIDGVLGFDVLSRFELTIDYRARGLRLRPYPPATPPRRGIEGERFHAGGLVLTRPDASWEFVTDTPLPNTPLILKHPSGATARLTFQELHGLSVVQLAASFEASLALQVKEFKQLAAADAQVAGTAARIIDFTGLDADGRPVRSRFVALKPNERLWTLTCTAPADAFATHAPAFDALVSSLRPDPD